MSITLLNLENKDNSQTKLLELAGLKIDESKRNDAKSKTVMEKKDLKITLNAPTVPVSRKVRNNLKKMDTINNKDDKEDNEYDNLMIIPAAKISNNSLDKDLAFDDNEDIKHEGHLYKITEQKCIKRLWFKLVHKDLYCKIKII
jgi:hypothetical protein